MSANTNVASGSVCWFDGEFMPVDRANISIMNHTLHYGLGVFEGIRCYQGPDKRGAVFRLDDHIDRLFDSAKMCLMDLPYTKKDLTHAVLETLRRNGLREGYIRPIAFYSDGAMGLGAVNPVQVAVLTWPWRAYLGEEGLTRGIRAKVSSYCRIPVNVNLVSAKICGQYVNSILAKREAQKGGYDEAIMLDVQGYVAEGSGENVFAILDGKLWTPDRSSPILGGITRKTILELAQEMGLAVMQQRFARDVLYTADEVFLTGTAAEITPVREIDDRTVGNGARGPVTEELQTRFFAAVKGQNERYRKWLTPV